MISKDRMDEHNELLKKLNKNDPGLSQLRQNIYKRFQIFWKNVRPRDMKLIVLITEYIDYEEISNRNSSCDLLIDSIMELYLESLHKDKSSTIAVFSQNLGATPYHENYWGITLSNIDHEDIRVRIRKKLSVYKEFSEGLLKHLLPYVVTCLAIVQNNGSTDFKKNSSYGLGKLISIIGKSKYLALETITNTKTGLSINALRNASAHSSIRTFPDNRIELSFNNNKKTEILVEKDINEDLDSLRDIVCIIKFSIVLFAIDNVHDLSGKFVSKSEDLQPEDAYLYLTNCFTKFQYSVEDVLDGPNSLISVRVKSLTKKNWQDILVELSIHLPVMDQYLEMINKKNATKVRIIGSDHSENEIGFVELSVGLINEIHLKENIIDVILQIQFFDAKKNLLDKSFNVLLSYIMIQNNFIQSYANNALHGLFQIDAVAI